MFRLTVYYAQKSRNCTNVWAPSCYIFGHKDLQTCRLWVNRIRASLRLQGERPKSLLVTITERRGQAFDVMASISSRDVNSYDGVVAVLQVRQVAKSYISPSLSCRWTRCQNPYK
ncbi:unnamed protein product [Cuscuta epithymum]|uniref:Uncharacterized protein n=1 Tax=Cuscuta epithymum TaxID=186058 RepID=A0AAV0G1C9_9ASTE|nr:unnamed protein product [Cuscuta epithymum]